MGISNEQRSRQYQGDFTPRYDPTPAAAFRNLAVKPTPPARPVADDLPIYQPEYDKPWHFVKTPPRTWAEALELTEYLRGQLAKIVEQLESETRREQMTPAAYLEWRHRAGGAKYIIDHQLAELKSWRAARTPLPGTPRANGGSTVLLPTKTPEERRSARAVAHAERIAEYIARSGIDNPRDPVELLRLAKSLIVACLDSGVELDDGERAVLGVISEFLNEAGGQTSSGLPLAAD